MRAGRLPRYLCWSLAALLVEGLAYLALYVTYTLIYTGRGRLLFALEFPITYGTLGVTAFVGGGLTLKGLYEVLLHGRWWAVVLLVLLLGPLLLWAGICLYALAIFWVLI